MRRNQLYATIILLFFSLNLKSQPGDPELGARIFKSCTRCHGPKGEGKAQLKSPRIVGRESWYLKNQLIKFKEKQRGYSATDNKDFQEAADEHFRVHGVPLNTIENDSYSKLMHPIIQLTDDHEIESVIMYIGTLTTNQALDRIDGNISEGKKQYSACIKCHGKNAEGRKELQAPRLTNQHGWYLFEQLKDFRMGWRGTHPNDKNGKAMRTYSDNHQNHIVVDRDDESMKDIIAYILSLNNTVRGEQ